MTSGYTLYTRLRAAAAVLAVAPAALAFGAVFLGWIALGHIVLAVHAVGAADREAAMNSGLYLRVNRDGEWLALPVEDLTDVELYARFGSLRSDASPPWRWIAALADQLREATGRAPRDKGDPVVDAIIPDAYAIQRKHDGLVRDLEKLLAEHKR